MTSYIKFAVILVTFYNSMLGYVCLGYSPQSDAQGATNLSTPPIDYREYPNDRPGWLDEMPFQDGVVVVTEAYETADQAEVELDALKKEAAATLIEEYLHSVAPDQRLNFALTNEQIDSWLVSQAYSGELTVADAVRYEMAAKLSMSNQAREHINVLIHRAEIETRVRSVLIAMAFLTLVMVFGGTIVSGVLVQRSSANQINDVDSL